MAASVTVLWLVAAFLGGAFSLTCYHCNTTGILCEENQKTCEATQNTCVTTLTEIRQDKPQQKTIKQLVRSCGVKESCNHTYSMSFNATKLSASVTCCDSDKCKTTVPEVKVQEKEKQLKCPYCHGLTTKCNDEDKASCFGEEVKCVSYTSKDAPTSNTVYTWKGCATENVCSMKTVATLPMSQLLVKEFDCSQAPSLLPGLLLPAAFGLAFLKLLL